MPNCFTLTRKTEPQAGPVAFNKIDEEMCLHYGVPCDSKRYHAYWYEIFGMALATGQTWEDKRVFFRECAQKYYQLWEAGDKEAYNDMWMNLHLIGIADWLEANFTTNAWYEHK